MSQRERDVDSVADPRFANALSHARTRWLLEHAAELARRIDHAPSFKVRTNIPVAGVGYNLRMEDLEPVPFEPSKTFSDVHSWYIRGLQHLTSPADGTVQEAYRCFVLAGAVP